MNKDLFIFADMILEKSKVMNLTAIKERDLIIKRHFLDSLELLAAYDFDGKSVIDIGSGAGLPGLCLKIENPTISLLSLDSTEKKITFQQEVIDALSLTDVKAVYGRAEELSMDKSYRQQFDIAVSRAVAALPVLAELCLPFVKVGGVFLAMKSDKAAEEIKAALPAISKLGGEIEREYTYTLPDEEHGSKILVIKKISPTPTGYPRRYSKIIKAPIK